MIEKKNIIILLPYVFFLISTYFIGLGGWIYYYSKEHWNAFIYTILADFICTLILFFIWMFSPQARANNANGLKSAILLSLIWFLQGIIYASIINTIIYDDYPNWISIPYAIFISLLELSVFLQFISLSTCSMPHLFNRIAIAWPSAIFMSSILLSLLLVIIYPLITWVPYCSILFLFPIILSTIGLYQTTYTPSSISEWDYITMHAPNPSSDTTKVQKSHEHSKTKYFLKEKPYKTIRIVQITDPHIGTMMSVERLHKICTQAVSVNPDLVLLTGDFYTVEGYKHSQHVLARGLEPLQALKGKVFACMGNHDYEHCAKERTEEDLAEIGAKLLVGKDAIVELDVGKVQIIGLDYFRPSTIRTKHIEQVMEIDYPPQDTCLRVVMLHDPGAFRLLPDQKNLVFSGHTHGGQFGLLSLGIDFTLIKLAGIPDQGYFEKGTNRLYVHRAHGCRSLLGTMMVRIGCPPEYSVLDVEI